MNPVAVSFLIICAGLILSLPKSWAPVAMLVGCCYMTKGQGVLIGGANFPFYRLLILSGLLRVVTRRENFAGKFNTIDKILSAWAAWTLFASFFHETKPGAGPVYITGTISDLIFFYFLMRIWIQNLSEFIDVSKSLALILIPIAFVMVVEKITGKNPMSVFGGVPENVAIREGSLRAQGPFRHPILAGTVGGACIPLFLGLWKIDKSRAVIGILASLIIVIASASSGPIMTAAAGAFAVLFWRWRSSAKTLRIIVMLTYAVLEFTMSKPPYYLITKLGIIGGSTGWHRAFLIEQSFKHFSEWWLFGTDRTKHWMPGQGAISPDHTDITNYYISLGVAGGYLALLLIVASILVGFWWVGKLVRLKEITEPTTAFLAWCLGASLFAHAVTGISVGYFDQSVVFIWLTVASISSVFSSLFLTPGSPDHGKIELKKFSDGGPQIAPVRHGW